jgi:hypothetical protein
MGIYKFGNNTYPRRIRRRLNLGHFFWEKSASYGPGNTVYGYQVYLDKYLGAALSPSTHLLRFDICLKISELVDY